MDRYWVNQPSKNQDYHFLHGQQCIGPARLDEPYVTVYFAEGPIVSQIIATSALSRGTNTRADRSEDPTRIDKLVQRMKNLSAVIHRKEAEIDALNVRIEELEACNHNQQKTIRTLNARIENQAATLKAYSRGTPEANPRPIRVDEKYLPRYTMVCAVSAMLAAGARVPDDIHVLAISYRNELQHAYPSLREVELL
jgi:DNA repair exonuclease SbcCD ATPase subunit